MSLKSILLVFATLLLGLPSCTEETAIDVYHKEGSTNKLSFVLSTSPTISKAGDAYADETIATAEELNISSCILAIFEVDDDETPVEKVCIESYTGMTSSENADNGAPLYKLAMPSTVSLNFSKKYKIIIIANPTGVERYTECTDYEALGKVFEGGDGYSFTPATLLKKGELLVGKGTGLPLSNETAIITVPLTQLAARIDLKIKVDLGMNILNAQTYKANGAFLLDSGKIADDGLSFSDIPKEYSFENLYVRDRSISFMKEEKGIKYCLLPNRELTREYHWQKATIEISELTLENVRGKVLVMSPEDESDLALSDYSVGADSLKKVATEYVAFYTYQRDENIEDRPLKVVFEGGIEGDTRILERSTVKGDFVIFDLGGNEDLAKFLNGVNFSNTLGMPAKDYIFKASDTEKGYGIIAEDRINPIYEVQGKDTITSLGEGYNLGYSGNFTIAPKSGGDIAYGNRYRVTATIKKTNGTKTSIAPVCNAIEMKTEAASW